MAAVTKSSTWTRKRECTPPSPGRAPAKIDSDYVALVILLVMMLALVALSMWLANFTTVDIPVDYWTLMP